MAQNLKIKRFTYEFTRPNDTTAYAAQDAVSDSTTAPSAFTLTSKLSDGTNPNENLVVGGTYQIKTVKLCKSSNGTTNASFDMYFYTSGVTNTNDNAAMVMTYANRQARIGKVSFTLSTAGSGSDAAEQVVSDVNLTFRAIATAPTIVLVATAAYTPIARENFFIEAELLRIDD